ncbi:hypothetical protein CAP35_15040 [Chitinophagaceae bacterium IBVUCB1]|nr:hypothetical protein CAP35_15040 [Chitinophagaceae bacterium IBVUCB1]
MTRKFNYTIVDDEPNAIELLQSRMAILFPGGELSGTYTRWDDAMAGLTKHSPDILFLDISMPEKTGIDFLKLLPDFSFQVIFVTAHGEFALQAIKLSAAGYILKPVDDYELSFAVNKALGNLNKSLYKPDAVGSKHKIGIPNTKGIDYLNADDILYFESINKYTKVVTKEYSIMSSYNLGEFKKVIGEDHFFQAHRSYIVNLNKIKRYETQGLLVMDDNMQIPISKNLRQEFIDHFSKLSKTAGFKHNG